MGVPFFHLCQGQDGRSLFHDGEADPFPITHLGTGEMIYILGRRDDAVLCVDCTHEHGVYFIQGLFSTQELAEQNALDEQYFIGPLPLNIALPHDPCEWPGLYWPLKLDDDLESVFCGDPDPLDGIAEIFA